MDLKGWLIWFKHEAMRFRYGFMQHYYMNKFRKYYRIDKDRARKYFHIGLKYSSLRDKVGVIKMESDNENM